MTITANSSTVAAIARIFDEIADVDPNRLSPEQVLREDLDVDSLLLVEITVAIEAEFGVAVSDEDAAGFVTVDDILAFLDQAPAAA